MDENRRGGKAEQALSRYHPKSRCEPKNKVAQQQAARNRGKIEARSRRVGVRGTATTVTAGGSEVTTRET